MDDRYPPPPAQIPRGYLRASLTYRAQAVGVLVAIALFVALYVALLAGTVIGLVWLATHVPPRDVPVFVFVGWTGAIVALLLALLFLLKGLLVRQARREERWIELLPAREPVFFAFLGRLAREVGAPVPRRVFLSPDVEAAVFQETTLLSLVVPPPKQLVVGLGLVNALELRELKAVLAHELGHFAQSTTRLGNYVHFAQAILVSLVHGRDAADVVVDRMRVAPQRTIMVVGWTAYALVAAMRAMLGAMLRFVVLSHRALAREMELQADRVSIAAAGSAAAIRALARAAYGDACLAHARSELGHATDHALFTSDLYAHQLVAVDTLPEDAFRPEWSRLAERLGPGSPPLFPPGADDARPSMWSTHPPGAVREAQARAPWIDAPDLEIDHQPAWALFADPVELRQRMTMHCTRRAFPERAIRFAPPEVVERFLADERATSALPERHRAAYTELGSADPRAVRMIAELPLDAMTKGASASSSTAELLARRAELYGEELAARARRGAELAAELASVARALEHAESEGVATFRHRGFERHLGEARDLVQTLEAELERTNDWFLAWDAHVADVHAKLARTRGEREVRELRERYAFHLAIQDLEKRLARAGALVGPALHAARSSTPLAPDLEEHLVRRALEARATMSDVLERARALAPPTIPGLDLPSGLAGYLLPEPLVTDPRLLGATLHLDLVERVARQQLDTIDRCDRVRRKSLIALTALHDRLAEPAPRAG